MERGLLVGIAALRWVAWALMVPVVLASRDGLARPWLAWGLVALTLAVTVALTVELRRNPATLLRTDVVVAELFVAAVLAVAGGWAYEAGDAFASTRVIGSAWPLAVILTAGVAGGPWVGGGAGLVVGAARFANPLANGVALDAIKGANAWSIASTALLFVLAGVVAGVVVQYLRRADRAITDARAREDVARTLHDGVLQTLAVIERRASDADLAQLAREQERELREYLFGFSDPSALAGAAEIGRPLRKAAARFEDVFGGRAQVVLAPDLPPLPTPAVEALAGAVGESLTNAGKHGGASSVTVYAEPAGESTVFCSVNDDGVGFDPDEIDEGVGIQRSIRERIERRGGRVEIESRPGVGVEVRLWIG